MGTQKTLKKIPNIDIIFELVLDIMRRTQGKHNPVEIICDRAWVDLEEQETS
jgi:hypothetical protein